MWFASAEFTSEKGRSCDGNRSIWSNQQRATLTSKGTTCYDPKEDRLGMVGRWITGEKLFWTFENEKLNLNKTQQTKGRRRQVGWFPATYVKVLAGGRMSGRSTPLSSSKINLHEAVIGEFPSKLPRTFIKSQFPSTDKVQAMYPYKALNDDELSFEPDDIISVLSRDEPDWWRGELNGIAGLFPSNYVRTFVSSGKKSWTMRNSIKISC